jgi:chromosome partitioning protein
MTKPVRIIAIANQKGGVGKTTTCVNLAASLFAMKQRVLLIDLDPQSNATTGAGLNKNKIPDNVYQVLLGEKTIPEVLQKAPTEGFGFDVLSSNRDLAGAEVELVDLPHREMRLKEAIAPIRDNYDYILIDCPPSLSHLTLNGLCAADSVLIPMQCEYYALEGLSDLINTIQKVHAHLNPNLHIEGLLRTMYDPRNLLAQGVVAELQSHFGDKLYRTVIPRNIRLAEAPSYGKPVLKLDPSSKGAQAYLALAGEMLRREEAKEQTESGDENPAAPQTPIENA